MRRDIRAPSPRVPPVAPCARRRWQNVMYAIAADPTNECGRRSMSPASPAGDICIGRVVGALLAYGRRLSLPSRRFPASPLPPESPATLFPCARRPCSAVCANAHPAGVRASVGRARPATLLNCAGFPLSLAFPPLRGSLRSPLRKRLPAPLWAPLRSAHASQARVRGVCSVLLVHGVSGFAGKLRSRVNKKKFSTIFEPVPNFYRNYWLMIGLLMPLCPATY